ncbi:MAG: nucleotidyltransferase family protein, partial [Acidimicrobiia bacterium]
MGAPHPALLELAAGRPLPLITKPQELLRSAREHRMTGLLWSRVEGGEPATNGTWRGALARETLLIRARHRRLWEALTTVTGRLATMGIEVATAKGVTAEARWYDRLGERPCLDLDLVVSPAQVHRIGDIVRELQPEHPFRDRVQDLIDRGMIQSVDIRSEDGVWIDIHADILKFEIPSRQRELFWERTVSFPLPDGKTVKTLDPETSLIEFLLHLNKDRFRYLLGYVDVARILEREELDWDFIDRCLRTEGLEAHAYLSLGAVTSTLRIPSQPHPALGLWRALLWRALWRPSVRLQGDLGLLRLQRRQLLIPLTARRRAGEAIPRLWERLLPPPELLA